MKKTLKRIGPFLVGAVLGGVAAPYFLRNKPDLSEINLWAVAGGFLLAFWVQVVVHEFGHFLFGKFTRMQFYSFRVGFLALERENHRLAFKLYKNLGYLGLCIMLPTRLENPRKAMLLYMMGGLVLNLLSFLVCAVLLLQEMVPAGFATYFAYSTAFVALFMFVGNVLPQKSKGNMTTDGQYLYDGLKKTPDFHHLSALFALNAHSMTGAAPATFMLPYLNWHQTVANPVNKVNFLLYEYYYYLDQDNLQAAMQALAQTEPFLSHYPATQLKELQKEMLFAYAFLAPDPTKAQQLYEEVKPRLQASLSADSFRAQSAYALTVLQDPAQALTFAHKGQQVADKSLMKSFIPLEKKLLAALAKAAQPKVLQEI